MCEQVEQIFYEVFAKFEQILLLFFKQIEQILGEQVEQIFYEVSVKFE